MSQHTQCQLSTKTIKIGPLENFLLYGVCNNTSMQRQSNIISSYMHRHRVCTLMICPELSCGTATLWSHPVARPRLSAFSQGLGGNSSTLNAILSSRGSTRGELEETKLMIKFHHTGINLRAINRDTCGMNRAKGL